MISRYDSFPVGELCLQVTSGATPLRSEAAFYEGGTVSWFKTGELNDGYLGESNELITELALRETSVKLFPAQTVLMAMYGDGTTITTLGILRTPATTNQACAAMIVDPGKCDARYLIYALMATRGELLGLANGGAQRNLSCKVIKEFSVPAPPLDTQRRIARVLGSLDDKIELNRRMNQTLEETARAIFRSWFVDFDPVRVKAAGGDPVKELGLSPEVAALFPDSFQDSELGEVPEGWETRPLDSLGTFLNGLALQKYPLEPGESGQPAIKIAELRRGVTEASDQVSRDVPADYVVNDGDLLFSWSGSLMSKVWTGGPGALNQHLFKVSSAELPQWLLYWWIQHHLPEFQAVASSKATTMGHIQRSHLRQALCVVPPRAVLEAANSCIAPLHQLRMDNELEARSLSDLRDYLLPRLLSGAVVIDPGEATP